MINHKLTLYSDRAARTSLSSLKPALQQAFGNVQEADSKAFRSEMQNDNSAILVIPGITGEKSHYYDLLGGKDGQEDLKSFVERGGILISICAGSYLIAKETEYQPPWGPAKSRTNPAGIFNALARGPISSGQKKPGYEHWHDDCSVINIDFKNARGGWTKSGIMYGNGPALFPFEAEPDLEILATYANVKDSPIAAAWKPVGHGAVLWLGVLPYIGHEPIDYPLLFPRLDSLMKELKPHEPSRQEFWQRLIDRIYRHLDKPRGPHHSPLGLDGPRG